MKLKNILRIKRFRTRIFISITVLMIFLAIIFSSIIYLNVEKNVFNRENETSQKILSQMKYNIDYMDEMVKNLCLTTYYNEDVRSLMNFTDDETYDQMNIINKLSNSEVASNQYVQSIYIYNNQKKIFYSTYNGFKYEDPELIKLIKSYNAIPNLKPVFRKMETYRSGDVVRYSNVLTYFMYELTDNQNNMQGAVVVNIKLDWLIDNIKVINMFNSKSQDRIYILDDKDEFVSQTTNSSTEDKEIENYIKMLNLSKSKDVTKATDFFTHKINRKDYIVSCIPIENINWVIYKVQPYDMVFEYIQKLKVTIISITVILLLLIVIAAYTLAKGFYKPVEGLLNLVGFDNKAGKGQKAGVDEFSYLKEVYKSSQDRLEKYREERKNNEEIIKTYFLRKLLFQSSSIPDQEFEIHRLENNISLDLNNEFLVIVLIMDDHIEFEEKNDTNTKELLKFAVINITSEILSEHFNNEFIESKNDEIAIIINTTYDLEDTYEKLAFLLRRSQEKVKEYFNISFTASISEKTDKIKDLTHIYNHALSNSMYRFVYGQRSIILPGMINKNLFSVKNDYDFVKQKKLVEDIKRGDLHAAESDLANIINEVRKLEYNNILLSIAHIVNTVKNTVYEINQTRKEPINVNTILSSNEILKLETIDEVYNIILTVIKQNIDSNENTISNKDLHTAEAIKKIIDENYQDYSLSASGIADRLRMSTSKISKTFKENFNMSLPEYINNIRLAKAVEWMENSRLSIGEIMLKVGIENESYFYKIFKAKYGTTPREYTLRNIGR